MPKTDKDALREHFLALMAAAPIRDYSADAVVIGRLGKLLTQQADDRAERWRDQSAKSK
jgi:hypothetical protein